MLEIIIAVSILLMLLLLAVPSLNGVVAERRLRKSLDSFSDFVNQARELSVAEHRAYLLVWQKDAVELVPEAFGKDEEKKPLAVLKLGNGEAVKLELPAALSKDPPAEWIFWASGNCEPAVIRFKGPAGTWAAKFSPLNGRAELISYAAR